MTRLYDASFMGTAEMLRNRFFFLADKLLGKGIKKQIHAVHRDFSHPNRERRLKAIEEYAIEYVPYYSNRKQEILESGFPVVTKTLIRQNSEEFISTKYKIEELHKVTTSGSSGTPMTFYRDSNKKIRQVAEVIYLGQFIKYYFGMKHGFIRATHPKSKATLLLQNEIHMNPTDLSDGKLAEFRSQVKEMKSIIGFPSTLYEIAQYCERQGDTPEDFELVGIISTAEPLLQNQKDKIEQVFGCPIQHRYATEELGLVAIQNPGDEFYTVNEASFFVEILKVDSDEHCREGEEGRIVITDLEAKGMPLIRYDTGDLGSFSLQTVEGQSRTVIDQISGRMIEMIYSPNGEKISPFAINVKMKDVQGVSKFQFVQKDKNDYVMNVVAESSAFDGSELLGMLKGILGRDANIRVQKVNEIEQLASGKTPYIINEYKRN